MFSDETNILLGALLETFADFPSRFGQGRPAQVGYLFLLDDPEDVADFERSIAPELARGALADGEPGAGRCAHAILLDRGARRSLLTDRRSCTPESVVLGYAGAARRAGSRYSPGA